MQVEPETQVVQPEYPVPPHWPHLATVQVDEPVVVAAAEVLALVVVATEVVEVDDWTEVVEVELVEALVVVVDDEVEPEAKVEPMGPN